MPYKVLCFSRELAEGSPYFEAIKEKNQEVLFCYEPYDELVLLQLMQFDGKNLVSVEKSVRRDQSDTVKDDTSNTLFRLNFVMGYAILLLFSS